MAAAARAPHLIDVTLTSSSSSSSSSASAAPSTQNSSTFFDNSNQGVRPSFARFPKAMDLCRNASLAVSTFAGSPMKRHLQRPFNEYESRSLLLISAQTGTNGSSNNSVVRNSKNTTPAVAHKEAFPAAPEAPSKTSKLISDVSNLIKFVNSRDIVELQLKNKGYEILIRKREALPSPLPSPEHSLPQFFPGYHVMAHTPFPSPTHELPTAPAPAPAAALVQETAAPVPVAPKQDSPPMLSPMAGTFYRSPGPGEPPYLKVGDKVQKGQVVCIVEAMKLMNEIEADQSGTLVEIVAEDGKAVSIDTPLFIIKP